MKPEIVDIVSLSPDGGVIILTVAEVEPWSGSKEQLFSLSQKFKNYAAYALDGQLIRDYPEAVGKNIVVRLDTTKKLPFNLNELIQKANEIYGTSNLSFESHALK